MALPSAASVEFCLCRLRTMFVSLKGLVSLATNVHFNEHSFSFRFKLG